MKIEAKAFKGHQYIQIRQPISGFHIGYERRDVWRVLISFGNSSFVSNKVYASEASASKAAKRISGKEWKAEP